MTTNEKLNDLVKNLRNYEWINQTIEKEYAFTLPLTQMSRWPSRSHHNLYDLKFTSSTKVFKTKLWLNQTSNKSDIRNWKINYVMSARPEVPLKSVFYEIKVIVILLLPKQIWSQFESK